MWFSIYRGVAACKWGPMTRGDAGNPPELRKLDSDAVFGVGSGAWYHAKRIDTMAVVLTTFRY